MKRQLLTLVLAGSTLVGTLAWAQNDAPPRGDRNERNERGNRGDRPRMDPEQMRQMMMNRLKEQLKTTDEEWTVIQPRIEKVAEIQRSLRGFGGAFGRGDRMRDDDQPQNDVQRTHDELRQTVRDEASTEEAIQEKLVAYRAAREKAEGDLDTARKELSEVLTPRQEAVLVMVGMLE